MRERNRLASGIDGLRKLQADVADAVGLIEMAEAESEPAMVEEGIAALRAIAEDAKRQEILSLLSGEADGNDCFVELNAGQGGTEAQDWTEMLMRMYSRWAEQHGFKVEMLEASEGEGAGLKSVTLQVSGANGLWLAQDRGRRAPPGAHQPVRRGRPPADELCPACGSIRWSMTASRSRSATPT